MNPAWFDVLTSAAQKLVEVVPQHGACAGSIGRPLASSSCPTCAALGALYDAVEHAPNGTKVTVSPGSQHVVLELVLASVTRPDGGLT